MTGLTARRRVTVGVAAVAAAVFLAIFDSARIFQAWRLLGSAAVWATVWGAVGIIATTAFIAWVGRDGAWARDGALWRAYRWAVGVWAVALLLGFFATHPRWGSDQLTSNLAIGVTTYTAAFFVLVFFSSGLRMLSPRTSSSVRTSDAADPGDQALTLRTHDFADPQHEAEVWHVHQGRDEPDYYIAHCDCDWVGTPYDKTEHDSERSARRQASSHSTNVAPLVVEI